MNRMYEGTGPRTREELENRRDYRARREAEQRARRRRRMRLVLVIVGLAVIGLRIIDPNWIVAAGAIWTCFAE